MPMEEGTPHAIRRVLAEVHLAMLRVGVMPDDAQARVDDVSRSLPESLMHGQPGTFEPFYVRAWSLLSGDEERRWQDLQTLAVGMREEQWNLREIEWCRRWLRDHPSAPGTELVLAWEDACGR